MQIALSTIKEGKVYGILPACDGNPGITREQFVQSVKAWAHPHFDTPLSIFVAIENDLYSVIVVLDINNDHEEPQQVIDIPVV